MKKILIFILLMFYQHLLIAKIKVDTIIHMNAYTSYCSYDAKNPLMVIYNLHKGGGDCSRDGFSFNVYGKHVSDTIDSLIKQKTFKRSNFACDKDYDKSYDRGHLKPCEDDANNCILAQETFRYWNCVPQTPALNRGIWKVDESNIRAVSQTDSLLVICGVIYGDSNIMIGKIRVPVECWKIVYSYTQHKVIFSYIYTNSNLPQRSPINYNVLCEKLSKKYHYDIKKIINIESF